MTRRAALLFALALLAAACTASTTIEAAPGSAVATSTVVANESTTGDAEAEVTATPAPTIPPADPTATPVPTAPSEEPPPEDTPADGVPTAGSVEVVVVDPGSEPRIELRMDIASSCAELMTLEQTQSISQRIDGSALPPAGGVTTIVEQATSVTINGDNFDVRSEILNAAAAPGTDPAIAGALNAQLQSTVGLATFVTITNRGVQIPGSFRIEGAEALGALQSPIESLSEFQAPFPLEPVGVGARWRSVSTVDFEGALLVTTSDYTVTAIDGTVVRLAIETSQEVAAGSELTLEGFEVEVVEWSGTSTGQSTIDMATISPISSTLSGSGVQILDFGAAGGLLEQELMTDVLITAQPNEGCTGRSTRP